MMELLGDTGQMEACFGLVEARFSPFEDSINLGTR
jgi:hypothetical protein